MTFSGKPITTLVLLGMAMSQPLHAASVRPSDAIPAYGLGEQAVMAATVSIAGESFDPATIECLQFSNGRYYEVADTSKVLLDQEGLPITCDPGVGVYYPDAAIAASAGIGNGLLIGLLAGLGAIGGILGAAGSGSGPGPQLSPG